MESGFLNTRQEMTMGFVKFLFLAWAGPKKNYKTRSEDDFFFLLNFLNKSHSHSNSQTWPSLVLISAKSLSVSNRKQTHAFLERHD